MEFHNVRFGKPIFPEDSYSAWDSTSTRDNRSVQSCESSRNYTIMWVLEMNNFEDMLPGKLGGGKV